MDKLVKPRFGSRIYILSLFFLNKYVLKLARLANICQQIYLYKKLLGAVDKILGWSFISGWETHKYRISLSFSLSHKHTNTHPSALYLSLLGYPKIKNAINKQFNLKQFIFISSKQFCEKLNLMFLWWKMIFQPLSD